MGMETDGLPRVAFARLPTPLEDAPRLAAALGVRRLLVKRDDLTDLALGGNKVRKLEVLLGDALAQGADTIITTAASQSNFLRATAAAASRLGLRARFVVRGRADDAPQGNLLLMRLFGAELRFVDTTDPYDTGTLALLDDLAAEVRRRGGRPYVIHLGTYSGGLAATAYVRAAAELDGQLAERGADADWVVAAVGSGGTHAGLVVGLALARRRARVLGASVNTPAAQLRERIAAHAREAARLLGASVEVPRADDLLITDAFVGPGYGIPTAESLAAVRLASAQAGLLLDPVYTGKAWAALAEAVADGTIAPEATVLFLHTGGAPNVFLHAAALAGTQAAARSGRSDGADALRAPAGPPPR